jgi:hypothetical protein
MARTEMYPWSLLTEVGDYFCVPDSFKPHSYMSLLVSQRNYRMKGIAKYACEKTSYGSIVIMAQVGEELPPYEFVSAEGILSISARAVGIDKTHKISIGDAPVLPKRTQQKLIDMMSPEMKQRNLPWWFDSRSEKWVTNPAVIKPTDVDKYILGGQPFPSAEDPYPEYYNLDEDLQIKETIDEAEDEWAGESVVDFEGPDGDVGTEN